jgi:hypothetical protein
MNFADSEVFKVIAGLIIAGLIILFGMADVIQSDKPVDTWALRPLPEPVGRVID